MTAEPDAARSEAVDPLAAAAGELEAQLKPYRGRFASHTRIPEHGRSHADVLGELTAIRDEERRRWHEGYASGSVYHGGDEHVAFLDAVTNLFSQANPLHVDLWPSVAKFEAEIVAMTVGMLHGGPGTDAPQACGAVTSGGTESILLAMKAYRDRARAERGIADPEIVAPTSAHAAFDKASQAFDMPLVRVPVAADGRADVAATAAAITERTAVVVGSAPGFPHGLVDPIPELAALAAEAGVGFHTDGCLGGFFLPWAERLGRDVPTFDFRVPGVTSISADTHKFGYAAKGTSVVAYRSPDLRRYQWFKTTTWPGGLYLSPTFAGSRPGALSAACWAAMVSMGEDGYLDAARTILEAADRVKACIAATEGLEVVGDPLFVVAFRSTDPDLDVYAVQEAMARFGWSLNGLLDPPAVHVCVTLRHGAPGVVDRFADDLAAAVAQARGRPAGGLAPIYGMAADASLQGTVEAIMDGYLDLLYLP